jgi:hypothetical protein
MSSKKELRRKRRAEARELEREHRKANPALLMVLGIVLAVVLTVGGVWLFGDRGGPGEPPWPGAVWSPAHGHWH